jgi:hypothetical protein
MAERKSFLLRVDRELLDALQRWANDDLRSLNGQIEYLLRRSLQQAKRQPSERQPAARAPRGAADAVADTDADAVRTQAGPSDPLAEHSLDDEAAGSEPG